MLDCCIFETKDDTQMIRDYAGDLCSLLGNLFTHKNTLLPLNVEYELNSVHFLEIIFKVSH